jgi:acyl-CoA thioester hydrolase
MPESNAPFVDCSLAVRYAETDAQRVVYHANYVIWFEVGRTTYCERVGYPYPRMEAEGIFITVVDVRVRYRKSTRYGDVVTIRTRCAEMRSRGCAFSYEVLLPDGSVAAEGETRHLFLDDRGRPRTAPPGVAEAFHAFTLAAGQFSAAAS